MKRAEMNPMFLACAINDRFAMPLSTMLSSLLIHLNAAFSVHIFVLDGGVSKKNKRKLQRIADSHEIAIQMQWLDTSSADMRGLATGAHLTTETYLRLLIPELVPDFVDRLIYLDSDLLVEEDLSKLWNKDMGGHTVLAVRDFGNPDVATGLPHTYARLNYSADTPYFNTGVMMMNLKRWRNEDIAGKVIRYSRKYAQSLRFADQDGLNAINAGDCGFLDIRWNVQVAAVQNYALWETSHFKHTISERLNTITDPPCILHFVGPSKPWNPGLDDRLQSRYFRYLRKSGWFGSAGFLLWYLMWLLRGVFYLIYNRIFSTIAPLSKFR